MMAVLVKLSITELSLQLHQTSSMTIIATNFFFCQLLLVENIIYIYIYLCVCVWVNICLRVCACVSVRVYVAACVSVCG